MPTYEYACRDCGQHLEVVQSFTDDPLQTCEACGGRLRKVFSAAGIIFKGSGYYVTDTRSERRQAASGSGTSSSGGSDTGSGKDSSSGGEGGSSSSSTSGSSSSDAKTA